MGQMNKPQYEKPRFDLHPLYLFDGVAAKCWGYGAIDVMVFIDKDNDNTLDDGEEILYTNHFAHSSGSGGHCKEMSLMVTSALKESGLYDKYPDQLNAVLSKTNSGPSLDIPIHDIPRS